MELVLLMDQAVDAAQGLPLGDHQQGQDVKQDVRSGQQGRQPADGDEDGLTEEEKDVLGPLLLEKKGKPETEPFLGMTGGVDDRDALLGRLRDSDKRLLLTEQARRQEEELFLGLLPDFLGAGNLNG